MKLHQEEIERQLSDAMPHGVREIIARGTGIYPKIVDAYFNPYDERKSPHFTVLHIQAVLDRECPEIGEAVWRRLCSMRDASRPPQTPATPAERLTASLTDKVTTDARTTALIIEAAADGSIDNRERMTLRDAITAERQNLDRIEQMLGTDESEAVN